MHGVQLIGSVPLADAEEVLRTTAEVLGDRVRRLPDGETGDRSNWVGFQIEYMARSPQLERVPIDREAYAPLPSLRLRSGASAADVAFGDLGYASAARASYAVFERRQADGTIPKSSRFQVSLPTPLAPVIIFMGI